MRRFSRLEEVYQALLAANVNITSLPATNPYRMYYEWKTDPTKRELPEASKQATGERHLVGVKAFGIDGTANKDQALVPITNRVLQAIGGLGGVDVYNITTATTNYAKIGGFVPAKAHLAAKKESPTVVPKTSNRITGRAYKKYTNESYTVPFGKETEADKEIETQDLIILNRAETHVVTFTPEKRRRNV